MSELSQGNDAAMKKEKGRGGSQPRKEKQKKNDKAQVALP
jgi:hypothetical protein